MCLYVLLGLLFTLSTNAEYVALEIFECGFKIVSFV